MKTFAIQTLGCKVNQYESQQIRQVLEQAGLTNTGSQQPDLVVVNTCCVTHIASAKSRRKIRKVQKTYPKSSIIVTGCLPVGQDQELQNIKNIIIAKDKNLLPVIVERLIKDLEPATTAKGINKPLNPDKIKDKNNKLRHRDPLRPLIDIPSPNSNDIVKEPAFHELDILTHFKGQCRAFLKVQDGCDAYCTYCIIPKIRQNVCNKDVKTVLAEAENLVRAGHREIILTGIFLGAYGQNTARRKKWDPERKDALAEIVDAVAKIDGLKRLRLSSLEPLDVTERLLEVMTSHSNIMPHLHLPLQAGSANVLRKMARQYTIDDYMRVIESVKSVFDRPAITTDIIVGFPGETEADFDATLDIAKAVKFAKIHVFSFSTRVNTPAEKMAKLFGRVKSAEVKRRSTALQALDDQLQADFRQSCCGLHETVIVEKTTPPQGRCSRYFLVDLKSYPDVKHLRKGALVEITI